MKEIKQTSEEQRQIRKRVLSLLIKKEQFKRYEEEYKREAQDVNSIVRTFLEKNGTGKGIIETNKDKISLTVVEPTSVIWDVEKLSECLPKHLANATIDKQIMINDYAEVVKLLKSYEVPAKEFTSLLSVKRELNEDKLNNLFETGHLTRADIKGCYTVKKGTAYVKLTKTEKKD